MQFSWLKGRPVKSFPGQHAAEDVLALFALLTATGLEEAKYLYLDTSFNNESGTPTIVLC